MASTLAPPPLRWDGARLHVLDQTRLPADEEVLVLEGAEDTARAIERLAVRGAPLIGVAAAFGLAMEVAREPSLGALERGAERLATCRPTARNLAWAVERVRAAALAAGPVRAGGRRARGGGGDPARGRGRERRAGRARRGAARRGAAARTRPLTVLTHCNSGCLAASGRGTGLGVIAALADRRPGARARVRGAAAAAGRAADRLGARPAGDRARAGRRRRGARPDPHRAGRRGRDRLRPRRRQRRRREQGRDLRARARRARRRDPVRRRRAVVVARPLAAARRRDRDRGARRRRGARGAAARCSPCRARRCATRRSTSRRPALVWALVTERGVAQPVDAAAVAAVA